MPNFDLKQQPQYPIKVIDTNSPISLEQLNNAFDGLDAITLCVRSEMVILTGVGISSAFVTVRILKKCTLRQSKETILICLPRSS